MCSMEGLMLRLKLQYFGHLMWRVDSLEKTLMLGGIGGRRRRGRQRMRWLDGITDLMDVSLSELRVGDGEGGLAFCNSWGLKELDTTKRLNWTDDLFHTPEETIKLNPGRSDEEVEWESPVTVPFPDSNLRPAAHYHARILIIWAIKSVPFIPSWFELSFCHLQPKNCDGCDPS